MFTLTLDIMDLNPAGDMMLWLQSESLHTRGQFEV